MKELILILCLNFVVPIHLLFGSKWISHPENTQGLFFFRKTFVLDNVPDQFEIDISADSRFVLYVNNYEVAEGPIVSDIRGWNFLTCNIGKYLRNGKNVVSVKVIKWDYKYLVATKNHPAFFVRGNDQNSKKIETKIGNGWKALNFKGYKALYPDGLDPNFHPGYDNIDYKNYPWGWQSIDYVDDGWENVIEINNVVTGFEGISSWMVSQKMNKSYIKDTTRFSEVFFHSNREMVPNNFLLDDGILTIPQNSNLIIGIKANELIHGRLNMLVKNGKGAGLKVIYTDGLKDGNRIKNNRNYSEGEVYGPFDMFKLASSRKRKIGSLNERTCRFIQLEIETAEEPLEIHDLFLTDYCLEEKEHAIFECRDESLTKIWNAGAKTVDILSRDIAFSSTINEKIQFLPEAWAIGLANCYYTGNSDNLKNTISHFQRSLLPNGLINACAPCNMDIIVPHYALYYILMLYDYYGYSGNLEFVKENLNTVRSILEWYEKRINVNDVITVSALDRNVVFRKNNNKLKYGTAFNTILYIYSLNVAQELFDGCGIKEKPLKFDYLTEKLRRGIITANLDRNDNLFFEEKNLATKIKITNIFAMLADIIEVDKPKAYIQNIFVSDELIELSLFERFFAGRLLNKIQDGEIYQTQILPWHNMVLDGLTTLGDENYYKQGSDIYGGSVTPCLNLISLTAGISSYTPGFQKVMISPEPGELEKFHISCYLPKGKLTVSYELEISGKVIISTNLPKGVTGYLRWDEKLTPLNSGENTFEK